MGFRVSGGKYSAYVNLPSIRMVPLSSTRGDSFSRGLLGGIGFLLFNALNSSGKVSCCALRTMASSASRISSGCNAILPI